MEDAASLGCFVILDLVPYDQKVVVLHFSEI